MTNYNLSEYLSYIRKNTNRCNDYEWCDTYCNDDEYEETEECWNLD